MFVWIECGEEDGNAVVSFKLTVDTHAVHVNLYLLEKMPRQTF